ncbi:hypothetical protein [Mangrovimonas aestuarii]|uniref:hypothetical protein n=1 Tax=Mangrovimonas aestuarii TaxID=3018443 RepID=UPI00237894AB|nr:hypothetical protein [Mangrovimonas aestuarii]
MLNDKQSLGLTSSVSIGFVLAGVFDILDNLVVAILLIIGFLTVTLNVLLYGGNDLKDKDINEE